MAVDRLTRILARIAAADGSGSTLGPLCTVVAELTETTGAGVMVLGDATPQVSLCTTGAVSALIEELQYTFGEGPCIDAYRSDTVVAEPDLGAPATPRWLAFTPKVVDAGVRAIFGFPIRIGAARIGALNLYRDEPGPLSDDQYADALVMADVLARTILALQANAPSGAIPAQLDSDLHGVVHQATGMVSIQLDVGVGEALVRLRAHAFRTDRPLSEVAHDVVNRRLHFGAGEPCSDETL